MPSIKKVIIATAATFAVATTGAFAAQTAAQQTAPAHKIETTSSSGFAPTNNFYRWQVRVRGLWVVPASSSTTVFGVASVNSISNAIVPELDINYFFTPHISTELILGTTKNSIHGNGVSDLGSVWLLPPTLTVLYHFFPNKVISPYVGAGINYTIFYGAKSGATQEIKYDNAFGVAFQAGVDFNINKHWSLNLDAKKIFLKTDAHVTVAGSTQTLGVTINPWLFGDGVGYKF